MFKCKHFFMDDSYTTILHTHTSIDILYVLYGYLYRLHFFSLV